MENGRFNELYQMAGETRSDVKNIWLTVSDIRNCMRETTERMEERTTVLEKDMLKIKITAGTIGAVASILVSAFMKIFY